MALLTIKKKKDVGINFNQLLIFSLEARPELKVKLPSSETFLTIDFFSLTIFLVCHHLKLQIYELFCKIFQNVTLIHKTTWLLSRVEDVSDAKLVAGTFCLVVIDSMNTWTMKYFFCHFFYFFLLHITIMVYSVVFPRDKNIYFFNTISWSF